MAPTAMSVFKQRRIKAYGYYAFAGLHYEGREAQREAGKYDPGLKAHIFLFEPQYGFFAPKKEQHP